MSKDLKAELLELVKIRGKVKKADENGYVHCCTCWLFAHWTQLQGWHFIQAAKGLATKFELDNVNAQCAGCNGKANQGEQYLHWLYINRTYRPWRADEIRWQARAVKQRKSRELEEAIQAVIELIHERYDRQAPEQQERMVDFIKMKHRKKECKRLHFILLNS